MFSLASMTVRNSMLMFVAIAAAGALALAGVAFKQGRDSEALADRLLVDVQLARSAGTADMMHDGLRATTLSARLAGPSSADADKQAIRTELAEFSKNFDDSLAIVRELAEGETAAALAEVTPTVQRYSQTAAALVEAALTDTARAETLVAGFDTDFSTLEQRLDALRGLIEKAAEGDIAERDALFARARNALLIALGLTLAVLITLGLRFANRVVRQLGGEPAELRAFARRIADGELLASFEGRQAAGADSVAGAMLTMRDRLCDAVTTIRDGAHQVSGGSAQIADGNMELANRTEQQASQLQQTASSMEQMTGSVKQTAEHARAARDLAAAASDVAAKGGEAVRRVVTTMGEIQDSSRRIAEIIGVIDSIAFRTNILALNAAVEAARAGEQGRGFAVVAGEVRSLAKRSADAAQEIKHLIDNSVERVNAGHRLVTDAGSTMEDIVLRVKRVHDLIGEISTAAAEQTGGIALVSQSVSTLDHGTAQNAALVEQTAAAAEALKDQSARLSEAVSVFTLAPVAAARAPAMPLA